MYKLSRVHPPDKTVLKDISLSFFPGAKIGVLGFNGTGKSTLLRIMAGKDKDFRGEAQLAPGATVGLLEQEPHLDENKDVRGNVEDGVRHLSDLLDRFNELSMNYSDETADEFARLQDQIDAAGAWELDQMLDQAMDALRCPPGDCRRDVACPAASAAAWPWPGCCSRSPTCCCSTSPRTTWTPSRVAWLEQHLAEYKGTIVAVTHDRYFLDNVAGWILELDRGHGHPVQGQLLRVARAEGEAPRAGGEDRVGAPADDQGRARVGAHEPQGPPHQVPGAPEPLRGAAGRGAQREGRGRPDPHPGRRSGSASTVIEAEDLRKGFGDRLLIEDLSFSLPPAGIVGVIGPNGAGKTTLFRMIVGEEKPDSGTLKLGESVDLAYVDQSRDALDPNKTVWEEISEGYEHIKVGDREMNSRAYVSGFNFKGSDQQRKVGVLSGGERNRVHLAKLLRRGGNVLLLDEPTNDLDVDTLRALEQALLAFPGCAVIISHDRWFLDRVATHVLAFEGDSQVVWFEGNFEAYEEHRRARLGAEADRPHRITYKKLTRA